ncbi:MAG: ABC transporter ATP-binding protein [Armatimonadota bacterium]|nr:ABC transporter ATP-binding protein [Armatimonadota bacterium]MDR7440233.1 ABC transporter ATP-binding protein [Armatimonadota bacterium]MDR7562884.1 ABC transporter ATP-binding protein [Armatimonadota bacterium]MDR7568437.1 ABC transporter ATP-binding protein [Armatimonadota bacterium]MDR7602133.1 ABC transporter ATP-binding protein [Armatimonadota bacterium]
MSGGLRIEGLSLRFGDLRVLDRVDLEVEAGEFVCFVGPSGCGKSTLLNVVAGFALPGSPEIEGTVRWQDRVIRDHRDWNGELGYVFQRDNLLPWYTLEQNVLVSLRIRRMPLRSAVTRARQEIARVGLSGFERHFPHQLSGGMRQRASLARTLVYDPKVMLMDEPFGALDAHTRMHLQRELSRLWAEHRVTVLFVTHDLTEAITLGQRVVVLSHRPGHVAASYCVPFGYPRDPVELQGRKEFAMLQAEVWACLAEQFRRADQYALQEVSS